MNRVPFSTTVPWLFAALLLLPLTVRGITIDPNPRHKSTVDCGKEGNKTCFECGNTSGPTVEFCCRDPKNCTVIPAPAPGVNPSKHPKVWGGQKVTGVALETKPEKPQSTSPSTGVDAAKKLPPTKAVIIEGVPENKPSARSEMTVKPKAKSDQ
jgi:hypothetical protein